MHNGMTLTQIQGQGHRDLTVAKSSKLRQVVSHHKMCRKIGLLLNKVRFQVQICANQYLLKTNVKYSAFLQMFVDKQSSIRVNQRQQRARGSACFRQQLDIFTI